MDRKDTVSDMMRHDGPKDSGVHRGPVDAPADRPKVDVILVNYNRTDLTARCIETLRQQDYRSFRVTVVDNGSTDGSAGRLRHRFPDLKILESDTNLGFAAGCNLGLTYSLSAATPYVWLLNNDTEPATSALRHLVRKLEADPRRGAVGSVLLRASDRSVHAWGGGTVNLRTGRSREAVRPYDRGARYLTGASLLIRSDTLAKVGLLNEEFFLYWEDVDLCFRIRRAGWHLAVAEDSIVVHRCSATAGFLEPWWDEQFIVSSWTFFKRHTALPLVPFLSGACLRAGARARRGHWRNVLAIGRAVVRSLLRGEVRR